MILSNSFDPDVRVYKEAYELHKNGFQVKIHCWDRECTKKENELLNGIEIIRYRIKSVAGTGLKQISAYLRFAFKIIKTLKCENNYILHCHDFDTMLIGLFLNHKNIYRIYDIHENYKKMNGLKGYIYKRLFILGLTKFDNIIYVSQEQLDKMPIQIDMQKYVFLPNYPQKQCYIPITKTKNNRLRINYIGVVRDINSLKTLIEYRDLRFQIGIYGYGIVYDQLCEFNEQNNAILYGKFNGIRDSADIYRNTDILYCVYDPNNSNWKNAYFVKFYEAIVTQTPIIVTEDTLAGKFVKKHMIGAVVSYANGKSLSEAIEYIYMNYAFIKKNLETLSNTFLWENVISNLIKKYKEIIE